MYKKNCDIDKFIYFVCQINFLCLVVVGGGYCIFREETTEFVTIQQRPTEFAYDTLIYYTVEYQGASEANGTEIESEDDTQDDESDDDEDSGTSTVRRRAQAMEEILSKKYNTPIRLNDIDFVGASGSQRSLFSINSNITSTVLNMNNSYVNYSNIKDISPISGFVNVSAQYSHGEVSGNEATITFLIGSHTVDDDTSLSDFVLYRLILHNCSIQIPGELKASLTNIYSCSLIYPSDLYIIIEQSSTAAARNLTETELPSWLWWIIVALIVVLAILGWLVYRFWWKNKQAKNELELAEMNLQMALEEDELGFGNNLGKLKIRIGKCLYIEIYGFQRLETRMHLS